LLEILSDLLHFASEIMHPRTRKNECVIED